MTGVKAKYESKMNPAHASHHFSSLPLSHLLVPGSILFVARFTFAVGKVKLK